MIIHDTPLWILGLVGLNATAAIAAGTVYVHGKGNYDISKRNVRTETTSTRVKEAAIDNVRTSYKKTSDSNSRSVIGRAVTRGRLSTPSIPATYHQNLGAPSKQQNLGTPSQQQNLGAPPQQQNSGTTEKGIEWISNSCYIDAFLSAILHFTDRNQFFVDRVLNAKWSSSEYEIPEDVFKSIQKELWSIHDAVKMQKKETCSNLRRLFASIYADKKQTELEKNQIFMNWTANIWESEHVLETLNEIFKLELSDQVHAVHIGDQVHFYTDDNELNEILENPTIKAAPLEAVVGKIHSVPDGGVLYIHSFTSSNASSTTLFDFQPPAEVTIAGTKLYLVSLLIYTAGHFFTYIKHGNGNWALLESAKTKMGEYMTDMGPMIPTNKGIYGMIYTTLNK